MEVNEDMKNIRFSVIASTCCAVLFSGGVSALELKSHKFGSTTVTSVVTTALGYGDNVFRGSDSETSSTYFSFQPEVNAVRETQQQRLSVGYQGNGLAFEASSDDSFFSNRVNVDYARNLNAVSQLTLGAALEDGSSVRGTGATEGSNDNLEGATDFTQTDLSVGYSIGSTKIGPSLTLLYQATDLEFDNFENINRGRDYSLDMFSARFGYQYSVATNFFVDLSSRDFDYDNPLSFLAADLDNTEQTVHVGVRWSVNRLISGEISVGTTDKDFDNFQDPSSFTTWNAQIDWTPTPRDTVSLTSYSRPQEQSGSGLFQEIEQTTLNWTRQLSRRLSVSGGLALGKVDLGDASRNDDFNSFNIGVQYNSGKYSTWALNFEHDDKESSLEQFDFDSNRVFVSYAVSL